MHRSLFSILGALALAVLATAPSVSAGAAPPPAQDYKLSVTTEAPPDDVSQVVRDHVAGEAFTVSDAAGEPIMDIWFAKQLPEAGTPPTDPAVAYGTMNQGVVVAVMRLHREHRDFRDQQVPAGTYVARYLRQPDDGNHLGETTYRDFAVLVRRSVDNTGEQEFDTTLGEALQLNLHPFAWGLWPADFVSTPEVPGIGSFEGGRKWAVKVQIPRTDGSTQTIALVVVGNEWHYD